MTARRIASALALAAALACAAAPRALAQGGAGATLSTSTVALRAIARAEDERAWADGVLARHLGHADPAIRARAALAVGRLQDSTTVPALLPLLADTARAVRHEAVFALGQIAHRSARAPLEDRLAAEDAETVALVVEALGKLGDHAATPAVVRALANPAAIVRREAAMALWRLADSTALDPLLARHGDPDAEVRWRALYALEKIVAPDRVVLIAALHLGDPEWLTRAYAVRTIGRQRSPRGVAYVTQMFTDPEPAVVVNAVRALQLIADSTCTPCVPALTRLLWHADPYVRSTAATAYADRFALAAADSGPRQTAIDTLRARLRDRDAATRGAAARALIAQLGEREVPAAEALLADSSVYARVAAVRALALAPRERVAPRLLAVLGAGPHLFDRTAAAEALAAVGAREAVPALREGLRDTSMLLVAACAEALGALRDSASAPALAAAYAARAGDPDAAARDALRDALRALRGDAHADSVARAHPARTAPAASLADDFAERPTARGALLHTTAGEIEWAFFADEAPQTVRNFVRLAERGYFDGTAYHRVVPNFVIQDGDPTGTGSGGPGYTIRCEYNRLRYEPGMVGMALAGKDTGGSQWFITHSPQPHLNGRYTIFARVVRGMEAVYRTAQGDRIERVEILR